MNHSLVALTSLAIAAPLVAQSPLVDGVPIPGSIASGGLLLAQADFNGDGVVDVAPWDAYFGRVGISFGQQDGSFSPATRAFTVPSGIFALAAGDLDGDGSADFAVVTPDKEILTYLRVGEGWDAGPVSPWVGDLPNGILNTVDVELVDVDGDGALDLSIRRPVFDINSDFEPLVALGTTGGLFGPLTSAVQGNWEGTAFQYVDLNGDGDLDLVTANPLFFSSVSSLVAVIFNTGSLPLDPAGAILLGTTSATYFDTELLIADEEGDGDLDLYVLSSVAGSIGSEVLIASQVAGAMFTAPLLVASTPLGVGGLKGVDLEGDGDTDLILSGPTGPSVPTGPTIGAEFYFAVRGAQSYSSIEPADFGVDGSISTLVGDFDGDGLGEVISSGLRRDDPATTVDEEAPLVSRIESNASGVWAVTPDSPLTDAIPGAVLGAAPLREGELPALFLVDRVEQKVFLKRNEGNNRFRRREEIASFTGDSFAKLFLGDLNGDGSTDVMYREIVGPDLAFFAIFGDGAGAFTAPIALASIPTPALSFFLGDPLLVDLEGDGDLDLVFDRSIGPAHLGSLNDGLGQFGTPYSLYPGQAQNSTLQLADLDEDGIPDLVMIPTSGLKFAKGVGDGTFASPTPVTLAPGTLRVREVADFNGDGVEDLFVTEGTTGSIRLRWARGLGDGSFALSQAIGLPIGVSSIRVFANDLDLDGDMDVLFREGNFPSIRLLENTGQGVFLAPVDTLFVESNMGAPLVATLVLSDTEGDGDTDLLVLPASPSDASIWWVENESVGSVGSEYCGATVPNSTGLPASLTAVGSELIAINRLRLDTVDLPQGSAGFFLASRTQGLVTNVPGSVGTLCLGGGIGRFVGPGQVQNSGAAGAFSLNVDLAAMPDPALGLVAALPGETWSFQAWYRDSTPAGGATSNFSSAIAVQLR